MGMGLFCLKNQARLSGCIFLVPYIFDRSKENERERGDFVLGRKPRFPGELRPSKCYTGYNRKVDYQESSEIQ